MIIHRWARRLVVQKLCRTGLAVYLCLMFASPLFAGGGLMVHPTRIVLEEGARSAQVELNNTGNTPTTYRLSFVNRRMTESGHFEGWPGF